MLTREFGNANEAAAARWRDYYALTKPGVVQLLVFTAIVGMLLATPGMVPWDVLVLGALGIGLAAACGAVVNQILDRRLDAQMSRTRDRPLPTGRIHERDALAFALTLGLAGLGVLALQVALGLATVWWQLPLALATAHNAGAALFLICLLSLNQRLRSAPSI